MSAHVARVEIVNFSFRRIRGMTHGGNAFAWLAVLPAGATENVAGLCQCATCVSPRLAVRADRVARGKPR